MAHRTWFSRGGFGLDFARRNTPGTPAAQRGSEAAAVTRRARVRPVTLARSAADETPRPVSAERRTP